MCKIKYGEMDTHRLNISLLCCFPSLYISEICPIPQPTVLIETKLFPLELFSHVFLGLGLVVQMVNPNFLFWLQKFCSEVARLVCPMSRVTHSNLEEALYPFFPISVAVQAVQTL